MRRIPRVLTALVALLILSSCMYTSKVEARYPPSGDVVRSDGADIHAIVRGQGAPVLMIHGASANAREYLHTLSPHLEGRDIQMIVPDRPGHGYSSRPENAHDLGRQAELMQIAVRTQTEAPVIVVGHSFGGAVALRFAMDYPDLTRAVILIAPVTHDWGEGGVALYNSIAALPVLGHAFSQFAPLVGPDIARKSLDTLFSPAPVPENYAENLGVDLLFRPPNFRANARDVTGLQDQIREQQLRYETDLQTQIIVFSGSYDTVIKPVLHAARLKRELPDQVILVKLPDEGHMPHHGKAGLIARTILRLTQGESVQTSDFED